jgi:ABC-type sugar transport system ATPase subunit
MIEVAGISVRSGSFVLSDISLAVQQGLCHAILGPTGSGKTVLLESIIGLRKPCKGKILLDGKEITGCPTERRGLAYVPQDLALFPHMSVRENILYPLRMKGVKQRTEKGIVQELVESLGIRHILDRSVRNLSGGERQRTALARAVASGCKNLVLDEPLSALHQSLKKELWYLLKDMQKRYDLAILMVTHDLNEAFFLGDTMSIIIEGRLYQQGSKEYVYRHPESVAVAKFLGITNLFRVTVHGIAADPLSVDCEELRTILKLSAPGATLLSFQDDSFLVVGIRSEHVEILMPGDFPPSTTNITTGTIQDVFEQGTSLTIRCRCRYSSTFIEAVVPLGTSRRFAPSRGQPIFLHLPEDYLFLMQQTHPEALD